MAFGFFRRRQKMVIIIMAVLMVSFLISFQGFESLLGLSNNPVIGQIGKDRVRVNDLNGARNDIGVLEIVGMRMDPSFLVLTSQKESALTYMLLLKEAGKSGVRVSDADAESLLDQIAKSRGCKDAQDFLIALGDRAASKAQILAAIKNWLLILKTFQASAVAVPPSEVQLEKQYRDLAEQIDLRIATIPAENFMSKVPLPTPAEVSELFNQYRTVFAGNVSAENPFGFGYRIGDQAAVQYLMIRQDVVARVVQPSEDQLAQYFLDHKAEFDKQKKDFAHSRAEIAALLAAGTVDSRMAQLYTYANTQVNDLAKSGAKIENLYTQIQQRMTIDAGDLLATPLKNLRLEGSLQDVIRSLAKAADLDAICYPWGGQGLVSIDPKVRVTLNEADTTLGGALAKINAQVFGAATKAASKPAVPVLEWASCVGFERTLFPVGQGDLNMFPLVAGESPLQDARKMSGDPILGAASSQSMGRGNSLLQAVFTAKPFAEEKDAKENAGAMSEGEFGDRMYVAGMEYEGQLLWRLWKTKKSYDPSAEELASNAELKARVMEDCQTIKAFDLAVAKAQAIETQAAKEGIVAAAKAADVKTRDTGLFARAALVSPRQQYMQRLYYQAMQAGMQLSPEMMMRAQLLAPVAIVPQDIPGVSLPPQWGAVKAELVRQAFTLVPANVEPPYKDAKPAVALAQVKAMREVLVMQRIGYRPAVSSEFDAGVAELRLPSKSQLANILLTVQQWPLQQGWFVTDNVKQRVNYTEAAPS